MAAIALHMDGALARAARHLCQISVRTVARRSGLDPESIREYEKGGDALTEDQIQDLTDALIVYGAVFIPEDANGGVGVRRKFTRTSVQLIETWESEGGPVADDDV